MLLTLANISTSVDDASFAAAVAAIGTQVTRDFQPEWGGDATLKGTRLSLQGQPSLQAATDAIIYLGQTAQDPTTGVATVYGYHYTNFGHIPYGFVYLDVCDEYGETWSCTLSHEVLELLADPSATQTVNGPVPHGATAAAATVQYELEICDPTQGDTYVINGIVVSNFVTKAYFGIQGTAKSTNFLSLALPPFGIRPGGYSQYEDGTAVHQVNGSRVTARQLAARKRLGRYRRNGRRAARLASLVRSAETD